MIYDLAKKNKEGTFLHPVHTYYSDEYAQTMCELYLKEELHRDEKGKLKKFYRLHARNNHTEDMAFAYDIACPNCQTGKLKQVGRQLSCTELGLYTCPVCNKR